MTKSTHITDYIHLTKAINITTVTRIIYVSFAMLALSACSCSGDDNAGLSSSDYDKLYDYAGEYARHIVSVKSEPMELDRAILEVNARATALRSELGDKAADEFKRAVGDSVRVLDAALYDAVVK